MSQTKIYHQTLRWNHLMKSNPQIVVDAKVAKLLLLNSKVTNQKPYLIQAIVTRIYNTEGVKPSPHIYIENPTKGNSNV
nr:MAG TPA: hypothetical protein [Bacteriophage sp.]